MIDKDKLIQSFEEIIGWPYKSPGSSDERGIDCSGAFVRAYKAQGAKIYHGSNTIYREHLSEKGKIASAASLSPGMAVFKNRNDGGEPVKYLKDGIGNMYHIGLVASVNPIRIIHATPPIAKMDTKLGNWTCWGRLKAVDYEGELKPMEDERDTIRKGAKGPLVTQLQGLLIRSGYPLPRYGADGSFGGETVQAVTGFQKDHGLTVDGICGPKTWAALLAGAPGPEQGPADGGLYRNEKAHEVGAGGGPHRDENAPEGGAEPMYYTVTIRALQEADAAALIAKYGGTMDKEQG